MTAPVRSNPLARLSAFAAMLAAVAGIQRKPMTSRLEQMRNLRLAETARRYRRSQRRQRPYIMAPGWQKRCQQQRREQKRARYVERRRAAYERQITAWVVSAKVRGEQAAMSARRAKAVQA